MEKLRVAINAQIKPDGPSGGIVTVLRSLAALTELEDGVEEYVFIGPYEDPEWMRPMLPPGQRIVRGPRFMSSDGWKIDSLEPFKRRLGPLRPLARGVRRFLAPQAQTMVAEVSFESDAVQQFAPVSSRSFFQNLGCDVIHFPFQSFEACDLPSVYNPHDLQHLHLGEFFTSTEISRRESLYPAACRAAHTVVVASQFVKRDVVERYGIESKKVQVIPWAPPPLPRLLPEDEESINRALQRKFDLARPFALYPAMTWEHKNHLRLLEAVAYLRDNEAVDLRVICTGFKTDFWPTIAKRLNELGLNEIVKFPGLVPSTELNALYRAAQFVFVPTLFEAASAPVFEAWQHGAPVACSKVTALPEQVADAALFFDPFAVKEIAFALARMSTDSTLREDLRRRGTLRLKDFSLERTAKAYRAVYRRAAGRELNEEDRRLLGGAGCRSAETRSRLSRDE
ncbi:MAG: glycosyltransferase family 4 protein [Pyrinomonadaceae bacterium]|nr:glycosyltransferase family 4 protein [Pyrinomonadaceae bacterium]